MDFKSLVGKYLRLGAELTRALDGSPAYVDRLRIDVERVERELATADNGFGPFADTLPAFGGGVGVMPSRPVRHDPEV